MGSSARGYGFRSTDEIKKDLMTNGPVTAAFTVYSDFPTYSGGVYKHTSGSALGGHAVKIIGWGVEDGDEYWLVMNSWNDSWGLKGLFKIAFGECGIDSQCAAGHASLDELSVRQTYHVLPTCFGFRSYLIAEDREVWA